MQSITIRISARSLEYTAEACSSSAQHTYTHSIRFEYIQIQSNPIQYKRPHMYISKYIMHNAWHEVDIEEGCELTSELLLKNVRLYVCLREASWKRFMHYIIYIIPRKNQTSKDLKVYFESLVISLEKLHFIKKIFFFREKRPLKKTWKNWSKVSFCVHHCNY